MSASPPRWSEVTALFGGAFDPPHLGHQEAVRGLLTLPGVKRVVALPTASPAHKAGITPSEHRVAMARLAFGQDAEVDTREITRAERTGHPTYTYDTLLEIRRGIPELAFVVGSDWLAGLSGWHRFPEILELAHWILLERKPGGAEAWRPVLAHWEAAGLARPQGGTALPTWRLMGGPTCLAVAPTQAPAIASRQIREAIARTGQPPEGALRPEIEAYLKANRLYGTRGDK